MNEVLERVIREQLLVLRPPPRLSLSEWADEHYYLSPESSSEPGRWRTIPYQRGIMDAVSDRRVQQVTFMKSARVGATSIAGAIIGYHIDQDPAPIMMLQPTLDEARGWSKESLAPMLRDCPRLVGRVAEPRSKDSDNTILAKAFVGGRLHIVGANSGTGLRRRSIRIVIADETDGYPPSAGDEGDPIKLAIRRTETFWNRKIVCLSTPVTAGESRIESLFLDGDQRRYYVPCPHCGAMDVLTFAREDEGGGHWMTWPKGHPEAAHFVCSRCGDGIEHRHKRTMVAAGEWRAARPFAGHASFFIWAAYSYSANATWGQIASEYAAAEREGPDSLKTVWNTVLGRPWRMRGDAPEWRRLWDRRERYTGVPAGVQFLTAGVDVQGDRLVYEVVGWGQNRESWSIESGTLEGDTSSDDRPVWSRLDALLAKTWLGANGSTVLQLAQLAIDSGWNTQVVYSWVRRQPPSRVMAVKGYADSKGILGSPVEVDVHLSGRKIPRGCHVWPVGVNQAKEELYGWLRLDAPTDGGASPAGYCHLPDVDAEWFKQLTAEQLVEVRKRDGRTEHGWQMIPGRQNHALDARIYARAAAARVGLDQLAARPSEPSLGPARPARQEPRTGWLAKRREMGSGRRSFWDRR